MAGTEYINQAIRDHQIDEAKVWVHRPRLRWLHEYFHLFNEVFFAAQPLPVPVISVESTRKTTLGHYVPGRNGFGLCHNINLNARHLSDLSRVEQLVILAHEMVHEWQEIYGHPGKTAWHHNKQWCQMAAGVGIIAARPRGHTIKITDPFVSVCRTHGIDDPLPKFDQGSIVEPAPFVAEANGNTTLKKWVCECAPPINLRIGRRDVRILCEDCGARFRRVE